MKKTLLIAALSMAATPAFASKARLSALGNAEHVSDIQRTFDRPYEATMHGEYATLEFGGVGTAEAGFNRQVSEGNYLGFYVNRKPAAMVTAISADADLEAAVTPLLDNSLNVFYGSRAGEIAWGVNFYYLSSNKKGGYEAADTATTAMNSGKADVMGLSVGAAAGNWEADAVIGLAGKATFEPGALLGGLPANTEAEFKSTSNMAFRGAYKMDNMYYFAKYATSGAKLEVGGNEAAKADSNTIEVGLINSMKSEGAEFFYGVSYLMNTTKETVADDKTETTALPLVVGVEAEANSWMVLRGSVRHNLPILSKTKSTVAGVAGEENTLASGTTIAVGAGFKMNKFTLDAIAAAGTTGQIGFDGPNFLTNAALTYNF